MAPTTTRLCHHVAKNQVIEHPAKSADHTSPEGNGVPNGDLANFAQIPDSESEKVTQKDIDRADAVRIKLLRRHRKRAGMTLEQAYVIQSRVLGPRHNMPSSPGNEHWPSSSEPLVSTICPIDLHPHRYFLGMKRKAESLWETSGLNPGHPGFGFRPDGTPTGSQYILYTRHRGYLSLMSKNRSSPSGAAQKKAVCEELERGGWTDPEDNVLQTVAGTRTYKHNGWTLRDARRYNTTREKEELESIQRKNVELDFE